MQRQLSNATRKEKAIDLERQGVVKRLQDENAALKKQVADAAQENATSDTSMDKEFAELKTKYANLRDVSERLLNSYKSVKAELAETQKQMAESESIAEVQPKPSDNAGKVEQLAREVSQKEQALKNAEKALKDSQREIVSLAEKVADMENSHAAALTKAQADKKATEDTLQKLKTEYDLANTKLKTDLKAANDDRKAMGTLQADLTRLEELNDAVATNESTSMLKQAQESADAVTKVRIPKRL